MFNNKFVFAMCDRRVWNLREGQWILKYLLEHNLKLEETV
jgi:hypothetical protein